MGTLISRFTGPRRGVAIAAVVVLAGGLAAGVSTLAGAAPSPSISQVQAQVNSNQAQYDKASQQYDQYSSQLTAAKARLNQVQHQVAADTANFSAARTKVVRIAAANYEDSGETSLAGLLTNSDPGTVLSMASIITELAGSRNAETQTFLAAAQQLQSVQSEQQHYTAGIQALVSKSAKARSAAQSALDKSNTLLANLTAAQRATVTAHSVGGTAGTTGTHGTTGTNDGGTGGTGGSGGTSGSGSGSGATPPVPVSGAAGAAVAYEFAQIGCPYVWGATGPCGSGFDCSGLAMAAWAHAGVSIPRDTYEQWAALPHISMSDLEPGDLIYYDGEGHVAMYVGGGMIIDAPHSGADVEEIPESTDWYAQNADGAVRP
ncbi:MAG TPA: NlpC/P60 family protein [Trebonia sp.]|nr:NlpC/P60 family protein [Trebonia sp.]